MLLPAKTNGPKLRKFLPVGLCHKTMSLLCASPIKGSARTRRRSSGMHAHCLNQRSIGGSSRARRTSIGDRFIPSRVTTDMELGHTRVVKPLTQLPSQDCAQVAEQYKSVLHDHLFRGSPSKKVLSFGSPLKNPQVEEGLGLHKEFGGSARVRKVPTKRSIPTKPVRVLDAPDIVDDYYLNLLDWGNKGILAVALASKVYLWNSETGDVHELLDTEDDENMVTSLRFSPDGGFLAVGTASAELELWDVGRLSFVRDLPGHMSRIASLSWNPTVRGMFSSGSRDASIFHHDVRLPAHHISSFKGHTQEVCGMQWSGDGSTLASGGNDNKLLIWDLAASGSHDSTPRFHFDQHIAAVKALAWCPFKENLLASGGGTADRCIRFWNTSTGVCVNCVDTSSQVCALQWSKHYHELVSSHGFSQNQLIVWSYPSMTKLAELTGHRSRVLHMSSSPDGQTIVSAASDETVRFWEVFPAPSIQHRVVRKRRSTGRGWRLGAGSSNTDIR